MPTIYNQAFKVPVWIVLQPSETTEGKVALHDLEAYLLENGALKQGWPSDSFASTVHALSSKGWEHAVKKPPFVLDSSFGTIALAEHTRRFFGPNKSLNLNFDAPWYHKVNRNIYSDEDYKALFNDVMFLQDPVTLSYLFDIGDKCFNNNIRTKVFYTVGNVHRDLLKPVSDHVIIIGENGDLPLTIDTISHLYTKLDTLLR